jgi:hypothetical protein
LGVSEAKTAKAISQLADRQNNQESELRQHEGQIQMLRFAMQGIVTGYEYDKLVGLNAEGEFTCNFSHDLVVELKRLRAMGLIANHGGVGLRTLDQFQRSDASFDLKRFFKITEYGKEYLALRGQTQIVDDEE